MYDTLNDPARDTRLIGGVERYRSLCRHAPGRVEASRAWFPYSERHLQQLWADERWRPSELATHTGETVSVVEPGRWNYEAGPDFRDAVLRLDDGRMIRGDVEIHVHPADWTAHGHEDDPAYDHVVLHVCWFPGSVPENRLPPAAWQCSIKAPVESNPVFDFDLIEIDLDEQAQHRRPTPCAAALKTWTADDKEALLESAGRDRLARKTAMMARQIDRHGPDQALYMHMAKALGYKHNKWPAARLALSIPFDRLCRESEGDPLRAYALLAGIAGLLPDPTITSVEPDAAAFLRRVWDLWWPLRPRYEEHLMERREWTLSSLRPQNHPQRRLMALAHWAIAEPGFSDLMAGAPVESLYASARTALSAPVCPFWSYRLSYRKPATEKPIALIGPSRITAILVNVVLPFRAALSRGEGSIEPLLKALPDEQDNRITREMAVRLLGPDYPPSFIRHALRKQGLLQVYHDFCLASRYGCPACRLPQELESVS